VLPKTPQATTASQTPDHLTRVVRCAVPVPLIKLLDYLPPCELPLSEISQTLIPGQRVRVPLGRREVIAVVVECVASTHIETKKLKSIVQVIDPEPLFDPLLLKLLLWTSHYYLHPPGEVLPLGLSPRERRGEPSANTGAPGIMLNERGMGLPTGALSRAKKQSKLVALLQQRPHSFSELKALGISRAVARELAAKNLVTMCDIDESSDWLSGTPLTASSEQQQAIDAIRKTRGQFACHLLDGITGSGKTEVYLQCAAHVLAGGQQVLVLIPEIGLTPQMIERFKARFRAPVVTLHSGLSESERDRHWAMARKGSAAIVLGTRSSIFVPLNDLGLVIVDEEHDGSYSQQDGLRYSARDVAVKRAQLAQCPIILGSATPSLESLSNCDEGRYQRHRLTERAGGATPPEKQVIDIRGLNLDAGLSQPLIRSISQALAKGQQALLFLNRRGFAPSLICHDCGWHACCQHCDARMAVHHQPAQLRCHHCNARNRLPPACPSCFSRRLMSVGLGTEQTEIALRRLFPEFNIYRVDSDSMTSRHAMAELTQTLNSAGPCVILGTQMLTKGHHFPGVTLVGVVDADALLFSPDFRGEERLLQLLTQVGGRSGRGTMAGNVLIQTHYPDNPLLKSVLVEPYWALGAQLLKERQQRGLPPMGAMTMIRCDSRSLDSGLEFLSNVRALVPSSSSVQIIGPMPAGMARRAGRYRTQLLLLSQDRRALRDLAYTVASSAERLTRRGDLKWFMDVDPVDSL